jgi:hypothetical protein
LKSSCTGSSLRLGMRFSRADRGRGNIYQAYAENLLEHSEAVSVVGGSPPRALMENSMNPSHQIDELIAGIPDWRGDTFAKVRKTILAADAKIVEEFKWMGSPLWSCDGMIAVANAFKSKVNVTFAYGAKLPDPDKLFNSGMGGNTRRAIDYFEGDKVNERALKALVRAAIEYNKANLKKNAPKAAKAKPPAR